MVKKEELRLGQEVLLLATGRRGTIDALTQTSLGVLTADGAYVVCGYGEIGICGGRGWRAVTR